MDDRYPRTITEEEYIAFQAIENARHAIDAAQDSCLKTGCRWEHVCSLQERGFLEQLVECDAERVLYASNEAVVATLKASQLITQDSKLHGQLQGYEDACEVSLVRNRRKSSRSHSL